MKRTTFAAVAAVLVAAPGLVQSQAPAARKGRPLPQEFGRVVLDNESTRAGVPPVVFEHWLHRAKFTCRLCHVDLAFAMSANGTKVKAADNAAGQYCGACHDGRRSMGGRAVFESCRAGAARPLSATCLRCHSSGRDAKPQVEFATITKGLPRGRFGNGVDWEKAEEMGMVKLVDQLPGVSIPRQSLAIQKDFALSPKVQGMPEIIFSHVKHTAWNGCELCHPDVFPAVKRGTVRYTMTEIFAGKYCGVCHLSVAFPMQDCQRCHVKAVQ
ncbi:MAG TPA: c(7)-type cytochrome triheme domain-containing protein [Anaeromyxobacteraceae bacterium]|nr:c(7)-type cytochrome triheme domain-containing protein [Anaeromyxobacteraceae bacterium]